MDEFPVEAPRRPTPSSCFERSLPGEYLAMALKIHSGLGLLLWAAVSWIAPEGLLLVAAGSWIVTRSSGILSGRRLTSLVTTALAVGVILLWQPDVPLPNSGLVVFSPTVFLAMLGVILAADLIELTPSLSSSFVVSRMRRWNWYRMIVWGFGLTFFIYMIAIPTGGMLIEWMNPSQPQAEAIREVEELSLIEKIRLRSMEAMAALWFFTLGATVGSFLNVVAYRMPRRESFMMRRSHCPKCGTQIKGRDNVPIFGFLLLGGRCRACDVSISVRYPIIETIVASLFLFLYFVELISGGTNIPIRQPNFTFDSGVVWIIFYTKWDLLGFYVYHCYVLSMLFACVLVDFDRQRLSIRASWLFCLLLIVPPLVWPQILPVPLFSGVESWLTLPWLRALVTCLLGGALGATFGWLTAWAFNTRASSARQLNSNGLIAGLLAVVGVSLGPQAMIAILLIALTIQFVLASIAYWSHWPVPRPAVILFTAFVTHHAIWRWSIENGASWWPSHRTSLVGWVAVAAGLVGLLLANRALIRPQLEAPQLELTNEEPTDSPPTDESLSVPESSPLHASTEEVDPIL